LMSREMRPPTKSTMPYSTAENSANVVPNALVSSYMQPCNSVLGSISRCEPHCGNAMKNLILRMASSKAIAVPDCSGELSQLPAT